MSSSVLTYGNYVAGEYLQFCCNHDFRADGTQRAAIWFHGAGNDFALGPVERAIVSRGIPLIAADLGGTDTWGADVVQTRVQTAWTYAQTRFGVKGDKYGVWGGSMGSLAALLQVLADPTHVSVMAAALSIVDPEQVRTGVATYTTAIQDALCGGAATTVPSNKRPNQNASSYVSAGVPIKLWISETDTVGDATLAHSFVTAIGCQSASLGSVGHNYNGIDLDAAYSFLGVSL